MRARLLASAVLLSACNADLPRGAWLVDAEIQRPGDSDALRSRTARIRHPLVSGAGTPAALDSTDAISVALFDDLLLEAESDRVGVVDGTTMWSGHVLGWPDREVVLSRTRDGYTAGVVRLPDSVVRITPTDRDEILIEELAADAFGTDIQPLLPGFLPVLDRAEGDVETVGAPIVDVLVAASAPAGAAVGGESGLEAVAASLIAQANEGYADSGVGMRLRLAGVHLSAWDESGFAWTGTLSDLADTTDGTLDDVAEARDDVGADVVSLLVAGDGGACGLGYLMSPARAAFAPAAYSLVDRRCAGANLSFAHEIGHNLGLHHDRDNASGSGATPYAYGYRAEEAGFRTVMAYACDGAACPRVNLWSTPDASIDGTPAGRPVDAEDSAHNVATMGLTAGVAQDFRAAIETPEPEAAHILMPADGTTLPGASLSLTWGDAGADGYLVTVGSSAGGADLANLDVGTAVSTTITGLPTDGSTLYVTVWSDFDGAFLTDAHTYVAADPIPRKASLESPIDGATLPGAEATFTWSDAKADSYALVLSSTAEGSDLGTFGTAANRLVVRSLPTDGRTIWATLHSKDGDTWRSDTHTYTAHDADPDLDLPAVLIEPAPGRTLTGRTLRFTWTDPGASAYALTVVQGTTELAHESGTGTATTVTLPSGTAAGLIEVRLASELNGRWFSRTYTFTLE